MEDEYGDLTITNDPDGIILRRGEHFQSMMFVKYPIPVVVIVIYLMTLWVLTKWMEDRSAFDLKVSLRIYNFCQVITNFCCLIPLFMQPQTLTFLWHNSCRLQQEGFELLTSDTFSLARKSYYTICWLFLVLKMVDLLDTIFMILKKNNDHVTFLHVYHHTMMVFSSWFTLRYAEAFQGAIPGTINMFVHTIMYSYYFLSTFGPSVQKYLWWKRHLTKLQLAQFLVIISYMSSLYFNGCPISKSFLYIWLFNVVVFLCLFINFYIKTYVTNQNITNIKAKTN